MKLDRYDLALVNAACGPNYTSRPNLQCLHLHKGWIEATDGFMLAVRKLDLEEGEDKPESLLPAEMVKQIKASRKQQIILKLDNGNATVTYQDEEGKPSEFEPTYAFKAYRADKPFPDIDQLFPSDTTKKTHIAVSVGLLKKLLAIMPNEGILRLGITEPTSPLEFECSNMDRPIRGMLTPMFVNWDSFTWQRDRGWK